MPTSTVYNNCCLIFFNIEIPEHGLWRFNYKNNLHKACCISDCSYFRAAGYGYHFRKVNVPGEKVEVLSIDIQWSAVPGTLFLHGILTTNFNSKRMKNVQRIFVVYGIELLHISPGSKRLDVIADIESKNFTEEFNFGHNLFQFFSSPKHSEKKLTMIYINDAFEVEEIQFLNTAERNA